MLILLKVTCVRHQREQITKHVPIYQVVQEAVASKHMQHMRWLVRYVFIEGVESA